MRKVLLAAALFGATFALTQCQAAKEAAEKALGKMSMKGTVSRAGSGVPIEGATVRAIKLLDLDAIKQLVEYKKIPDGEGGQKDQVRIKLEKVHAFAADAEAKTDASGKFELSVDTNVYLLYTFGPGDAPGGAAAYSVHFWGINPETGELDLDHLIGKDGKLEQVNDKIELAGGPVPPPPSTPVPTEPEAPAAPATPPSAPIAADPAPGAVPDATRPEDIVPPTPSTSFWTSINLTHADGVLGTGSGTYASDTEVKPTEGERYMTLKAELTTAQTDPVYLVLQTGFDSTTIQGCETTQSRAVSNIYEVLPNGTSVEYKLVSPGSYYRLYFAKTATRADGQAVEATEATNDIRVGQRQCADAVPERPFLATLTWDRESDVDLHVFKYDAAKVATGDMSEALVDQANWTRREGETLSLDVDNTWANGPENNGESALVTTPDSYCYVVQVHLYSKWGDDPVQASVHVMHVTKDAGVTKVNQYQWSEQLTEYGQWKPVGIYGPAGCEKLAESTTAAN